MTDVMRVSDALSMRAPRSSGERVYLADAHALCRWYATQYGEDLTAAALVATVLARYRQHCLRRHARSTWRRKRSALRWLLRELAPYGADATAASQLKA